MRSTVLIGFLSLAVAAVWFVKSRAVEPEPAAEPLAEQVKQHHWPKNALDRASDLKSELTGNRQDGERD